MGDLRERSSRLPPGGGWRGPAAPRDRGRARRGRRERCSPRRIAIPLLVAFATASLATAASAQSTSDPVGAASDPYATSEQQLEDAREQTGLALDTDFTPDPKETALWTQVEGARYPSGSDEGVEPIAPPEPYDQSDRTTFDTDLFEVAFRNTKSGFAAGSACEQTPEREPGELPEIFGERAQSCEDPAGNPGERVPVIYRYTDTPQGGKAWKLSYKGDTPGYVGAIAWIDSNRVLAVGGDGEFPRREPAYGKDIDGNDCPTPPTDELGAPQEPFGARCDQAGVGRAWLYERSSDKWTEIDDLPDAMRGMTALDCHSIHEVCFAGALGQVWHWEGDRFTHKFDMSTPPALQAAANPGQPFYAENPKLFLNRVREIRFVAAEKVNAFAVTDGCCAENPAFNTPRLLAYQEDASTGGSPRRWNVRALKVDYTEDIEDNADDGGELAARRVDTRPGRPDSFYAFSLLPDFGQFVISAITSPGGPEAPGERASVITQRNCIGGHGNPYNGSTLVGGQLWNDALADAPFLVVGQESGYRDAAVEAVSRAQLSTARLVAADGDTGRVAHRGKITNPVTPGLPNDDTFSDASLGHLGWSCRPNRLAWTGDGILDWAAGELRSTRLEELGARGLAAATHLRPDLRPDVVNDNPTPDEILDQSYRPTTEKKLGAYMQAMYFLLPSYSVNALDMIGESGTGWAVGDRGAILFLKETSASGAAGSGNAVEPDPPRLGSRRPEALADRSRYPTPPTAGGEAGPVPSLASQPTERLSEGRLFVAGSPDPSRLALEPVEDVSDIAMSRDGSEGWAIGPSVKDAVSPPPRITSLFHYDGESWSRCDPLGVADQIPADPACAGVRGLRRYPHFTSSGAAPDYTRLIAAARVPLENDSDPTNDDEFEAVAIGTLYRERSTDMEPPVVLRYRDGRWSLGDPGTTAVFAAGTSQFNPTTQLQLLDIAFVTPSDGWIRSDQGFYHYDGTKWTRCLDAAQLCDPTGRLSTPSGAKVEGIAGAGSRMFVYGSRTLADGRTYPLILYRQGGVWVADSKGGGYDPGWGKSSADLAGSLLSPDAAQGKVLSLTVAERPDGAYEGWAFGSFGGISIAASADARVARPEIPLLRLSPGADWQLYTDPLASDLLAHGDPSGRTAPNLQLVLPPSGEGESRAFIGLKRGGGILGFDPERGRWEQVEDPRPPGTAAGGSPVGTIQAMAPDGSGGFWAAVSNDGGMPKLSFLHYTDHPHGEVFEDAPHPLDQSGVRLTALAGAPDGTVWAATDSNLLARYDRIGGWETVRVPGWDPGRVVVRASHVNALAVGPGGEGLAVGEEGRIADLSAAGVRLDEAAGTLCDAGSPAPPCGTSRDLRAVAIAPDGSALAGGDRLSMLWRPAGGEFQAIQPPEAPVSNTITWASMPTPERAYLTTSTGLLFRGDLGAGGWSWELENVDASGDVLALDAFREQLALRAVAVDASGHGYAVGDQGLVLRRTGDSAQPWQRLDTGFLDDFTAVALPAGEGDGVLIGGHNGVILTGSGGRLAVARPADFFRGPDLSGAVRDELTGPVVGLALLPGVEPGQVEAWAGLSALGPDSNQVLHYASDPEEPLLDPSRSTEPLPDVPAPREGELSIAAFGKTECHLPTSAAACVSMGNANALYEVLARRTADEIIAGSREPGGPDLALFTGDAVDSTEPATGEAIAAQEEQAAGTRVASAQSGNEKLRRWRELIADRFAEAGLPLYGAIGSQDLSNVCVTNGGSGCLVNLRQHAKAGDNLAWRQAMADRPAPWGFADAPEGEGLDFEPLADQGLSVRYEDQAVDPDAEGPLRAAVVPSGGASTHYAVDISREGEPIARLVVLDNSLRSLAASDPVQQPLEGNGGQLAWLSSMLCLRGQTTDAGEPCTREPEQQAIVLANTPTYSYGPGPITDTASDMVLLESTLFRYGANLVVSGRLGWNARYWATAPGLHVPCPGGEYVPDSGAPAPGTRVCDQGPSQAPSPEQALGEAQGAAGTDVSQTGLIPFVVASGAGGKFGPDGQSDDGASQGYWHGYTIVRLDASGDPRKTIVEQRPVLDWVSVSASTHALGARETTTLRGFGREPLGIGYNADIKPETRYDEISSAAITHRYDLVLADPEQPWVACEADDAECRALYSRLAAGSRSLDSAIGSADRSARDDTGECEPYLCLPERIGSVDDQTGQVEAGNGKYPDTFAIAMLSVGDHITTWPLAFQKSPSFVVNPLRLPPPAPGPAPTVPNNPQAPPPPSVPKPNVPQPSLPEIPALPGVPPLSAAQPPEPQPPAPPAPPPPAEQPSPLDLTVSPTALTVATPAAVIQPPTPPVNPAPPSGARREARQRQAATQKSGADSSEEKSEMQELGGDLAIGRDQPMTRHEHPATRLERRRPEPSFTTLGARDSLGASAGPIYVGGVTLLALAAAMGFSTARPTPRSRPPEAPAPAWSPTRRR